MLFILMSMPFFIPYSYTSIIKNICLLGGDEQTAQIKNFQGSRRLHQQSVLLGSHLSLRDFCSCPAGTNEVGNLRHSNNGGVPRFWRALGSVLPLHSCSWSNSSIALWWKMTNPVPQVRGWNFWGWGTTQGNTFPATSLPPPIPDTLIGSCPTELHLHAVVLWSRNKRCHRAHDKSLNFGNKVHPFGFDQQHKQQVQAQKVELWLVQRGHTVSP